MAEKPRVLLAEDNEATSTLIIALLRHEFVVELARDGREAIEKLKSLDYSVVLLDLLMPAVDGYGVLDYLSRERAELLPRVLVVTASLSAREQQRVGEYKVCGVVAKPFDVDALMQAVRECAGDRRSSHLRAPLLSSGMLLLLAELVKRV